jgi:hypothetical protein
MHHGSPLPPRDPVRHVACTVLLWCLWCLSEVPDCLGLRRAQLGSRPRAGKYFTVVHNCSILIKSMYQVFVQSKVGRFCLGNCLQHQTSKSKIPLSKFPSSKPWPDSSSPKLRLVLSPHGLRDKYKQGTEAPNATRTCDYFFGGGLRRGGSSRLTFAHNLWPV